MADLPGRRTFLSTCLREAVGLLRGPNQGAWGRRV